MLAGQPRFLAATDTGSPQVVILGAPLDLTESFKAGTAEAPSRIRQVSDVLETYWRAETGPEVPNLIGNLYSWWLLRESNPEPYAYEASALTS